MKKFIFWIPIVGMFYEFFLFAGKGETYLADFTHPFRYFFSMVYHTVSVISFIGLFA